MSQEDSKYTNPRYQPRKSLDHMINVHKESYKEMIQSFDEIRVNDKGHINPIFTKANNLYANIYLLSFQHGMDLAELLQEKLKPYISFYRSTLDTMESGDWQVRPYHDIAFPMLLIAISEELNVSISKLFSMTSKEQKEITYSLIEQYRYQFEVHELFSNNDNYNGKGLVCSVDGFLPIHSTEYTIFYNREDRSVQLYADATVDTGNSAVGLYHFPDATLCSESKGPLYDFYWEMLRIDARENNIGKVFTHKDVLFRFFSPGIPCDSENKRHDFEDVQGAVYVIDNKTNKMRMEHFHGSHCKTCDRYFISDQEYERLKSIGVICCRIIETYQEANDESNPFHKFSEESILHQYGYNVNNVTNLSSEQRRNTLSFVVDNDILSRGEIIKHLEMLINLAKNRKNMEPAIEKWQEDIAFIENYKRTDKFTIPCDGIKGPQSRL